MSSDSNDENQPLVDNEVNETGDFNDTSYPTMSLFDYSDKQSPAACIFNFVNSMLGSGVLAVPYVFELCGYALGPIISLSFCTMATISFFMLITVSDYTNRYQFNTIADRLYHNKWVGVLASLAQLVFSAGCLISYVIVIRDNFWFFDLEKDLLYADIVLSAIMLCVVMPLCYLRTLDKLKFNSYLVVIIIAYILFVLMAYFIQKCTGSGIPAVRPFEANPTILNGLSLTIHSYNAHYNFLNLLSELRDRHRNSKKVVFGTISTVIVIYLSVGLFGYLQYGEKTASDILISMQSENSIAVTVANAGMIFFMVSHYPLPVYAMRRGIESFIYRKNEVPKASMRYILATAIVVTSLLLGILISSIDMVLDFTSSLAGGFLGFIFPGMFYAKCQQEQGNKLKAALGWVYSVLGMAITGVAFGAAVWKWGWNHGEI